MIDEEGMLLSIEKEVIKMTSNPLNVEVDKQQSEAANDVESSPAQDQPTHTPNKNSNSPQRVTTTVASAKKKTLANSIGHYEEEHSLPWSEFVPYGAIGDIASSLTSWKKHVKVPVAIANYLDDYFECTRAGSTVETEIFAGIINFFSCMYIIAVLPPSFARAGYDSLAVACAISLMCGIGSIACGLVTNTPLIVAPSAAVSIYFASNLQQNGLSTTQGNMAVTYAGMTFLLLGVIGPLGRFITKMIPKYIQIATTIGIGLLTVLSAFVEIRLVVQGKYTLVAVGKITDEIIIAFSGLILIWIGNYYHSKVSYLIGLAWGTFLWWTSQDLWPTLWAEVPTIKAVDFHDISDSANTIALVFQIVILLILTLFGLAKALCDLALITPPDDSIPKGRYIVVIVGACNILSGLISGPPIILSPETASGIKAGAKTGLSAIVCGSFFLLSVFFAPVFKSIPPAATSPILIMVGLILFQNIKKIDFSNLYGIPAFVCMTLIPFSDSIIAGLGFGFVTYIIISIITGDIKRLFQDFVEYYFPSEERVSIQTDITSSASVSLGELQSLPSRANRNKANRRGSAINATSARRASVAFMSNISTEVNMETGVDQQML